MNLNTSFLLLKNTHKYVKKQTFNRFSLKIFFSSFLQIWILFLCLLRDKKKALNIPRTSRYKSELSASYSPFTIHGEKLVVPEGKRGGHL